MEPIEPTHLPLDTLPRQVPGSWSGGHRYRLDFCCKGEQCLELSAMLKKTDRLSALPIYE